MGVEDNIKMVEVRQSFRYGSHFYIRSLLYFHSHHYQL